MSNPIQLLKKVLNLYGFDTIKTKFLVQLKGDYALGIFIDSCKAFDTINHEILLHKLQFCGTMQIYCTLGRFDGERMQKVI